jgi:hypothetical protein
MGNLAKCPKCDYCGHTEYLKKILEVEPICPMCQAEVQPQAVEIIPLESQNSYLRSISFGNIEEPEKDKGA